MLAAALGLVRLAERQVTYDESVSVRLATVDLDRFWDRAIEGGQLFGALYYGLLRPWTTLGADPFVVRLLSVLFAVAAIAAAYFVARRMFGTPVATAATVILAINPFFIRYAQDARPYALALFLTTLATYLMLTARDRPSPARWVAYAVVAAASAFAHLFAVLVLLVHLGVLVRSRLPAYAWIAVAGAAVAIVPFAALVVLEGPPRSFIPPMTLTRLRIAVDSLAGGWGLWPPLHGFAYAAFSALALLLRRPRAPVLFCIAWLVTPIVIAAAASLVRPVFVTRYLIVVLPALSMLVAAGAATVSPRWLRAPAFGVIAGLSILGLAAWYTGEVPI